MVKLSPQKQAELVGSHPNVFSPAKGAWGRQGSTSVRLKSATKPVVREALLAAWRNRVPKKLAKQLEGNS
jgi:hypothetical protein